MADGVEKLHGKFMGLPSATAAAVVGIGAVTTAATGMAVAAFALGDVFDQAWDKIRAGTGRTGADLESLKQTVRDVVTDVPTDFDKASTAVTVFSQRLGLSGEPLRALTGDILDLSRITKTDLNENLKESSSLFRSWSVTGDDQRETLNQLLRAYQATGVSVTDLSRSVNEGGPLFRSLNLSLSESIALTAGLEREGVDASIVVRGMNTAIAKLAQAGVDASTALPDLLESIRSLESPTEAVSLAVELFGARAGPRLAEAIRAGRLEVAGLLDDIENGSETIPRLASDTEDAAEKMDKAWNKARLAAEPLATAIFNLATKILDDANPAIEEFAKDLDNIQRLFTLTGSGAVKWADVIGEAAGAVQRSLINLSPAGIAAGLVGQDLGSHIGAAVGGIGNALDQAGRSLPGGSITGSDPAEEAFQQSLRRMEAAAIAGAEDVVAAETEVLVRGGALAGGRHNQALIDALKGGRGSAGGTAAASTVRVEAERVVETAIDGYMAAMTSNRANLQDRFGELGTGAASALSRALVENTKSAGASVFREVENIVLKLQKDGVPDWRELGDDLAGAFHGALISRLDADKEAALSKLEELRDLLRARNALTPENLMASMGEAINADSLGQGAGIMQSLEKAWAEGGEVNRRMLATQSASWIAEIRRGLSPERADEVIAEFTAALTNSIDDKSDEAREALESVFRGARLEVPRAAIEKALDDAMSQIRQARTEALATAKDSQDLSDETRRRRGDLTADQAGRMKALEAQFPDETRKQNAEKTAKSIAEAETKGQEAIWEAKNRGDTLATLRAMKASEDQVKRLREQAAEEDRTFSTRGGKERAVAGLREAFTRENDALDRTLRNEAYDRQIEQINTRATVDMTKAQERHDRELTRLNETLGLIDLVAVASNTMFDGSLAGIQAVVAEARTLATVLGITVPNGLGAATPGPGTEFDANGNLRSLSIHDIIIRDNIVGDGGVEELVSRVVAAEESLIQ